MSEGQADGVTLFEALNRSITQIVHAAAEISRRHDMSPEAFEQDLTAVLVGAVFKVLTVRHSADDAAQVISACARMAASHTLFGDHAGTA